MKPRDGAGGGRRRWRREVNEILADFPRQHAALEHAMGAFGPDFDLTRFKRAFEDSRDMEAYNRVQAVERATSRVQGYVAELAVAGARLADLDLAKRKESETHRAFAALAAAGVLDRRLAARVQDAQRARNRLEHTYARLPAGDAHAAALLVEEVSREFLARYAAWIEPYLEGGE